MQAVVRALLVALCVGGASFALAKLDLWGANSNSGRASDNIVQRLGASHYPSLRPGETGRTRDLERTPQVRIVYLGDGTMQAMPPYDWGGAFPTVAQQTVMISDIVAPGSLAAEFDDGDDGKSLPARRAPRVVFLDMFYFGYGVDAKGIAASEYGGLVQTIADATRAETWASKPVCRQSPLLKLVCIVKAGGVAVIVGAPSATGPRTPVQSALDWVTLVAPVETHVTNYPLTFAGGSPQISPALAMYVAACLYENDKSLGKADRFCGDKTLSDAWNAVTDTGEKIDNPAPFNRERPPIDVVWGARTPQELSRLETIEGCHKIGVGAAYLNASLRNVKTGGGGAYQACPYTVGVAYENVVNSLSSSRKRLGDLLSDNIVLVGSQMSNSGDWIVSPVQGPTPGVHYHAMALANLLDWGFDYRRSSIGFVDGDLVEAVLVTVLSFISLILLMQRNEAYATWSLRRWRRLPARIYGPTYLAMLLSAAVIVGLVVYLCAGWHLIPLNWSAVLALVWLHGAFSAHDAIKQDVGQTLEAHAWGKWLLDARRRVAVFFDFSGERLPRRRPPAAPPTDPPNPDAGE